MSPDQAIYAFISQSILNVIDLSQSLAFSKKSLLYARWTHAKPEAGFASGNRNKIYTIVELRPDRGGLIGPDISCLGRDEDGYVFMDDSS
jgi:hypothetical protein